MFTLHYSFQKDATESIDDKEIEEPPETPEVKRISCKLPKILLKYIFFRQLK